MSNKAPSISLPQGGGGQSGLGEKFSPDLFTGTGNFSVPVALPPGRNGFQPELTIGYSTGSGNSPFGLGWNLGIPGVMRKTSRGIPVYDDEQDVFILSGAEDLVKVNQTNAGGHLKTYYRPRTEGLYARIVHHKKNSGENYWEVRSKDGLISLYGNPDDVSNHSCVIANPENRKSIFAWRLYKTIDPFGNHIVYHYERELVSTGAHIYDQLYLSHILYGDYTDSGFTKYLLRVQFVYSQRPDPFSEYRQGFEVRTTRRCETIEMYTLPKTADLPEGYNSGNAYYAPWGSNRVKTKSYDFVYIDEKPLLPQPLSRVSMLHSVEVKGYDLNDSPPSEPMPPLTFQYSVFDPAKRDFFPLKGSDLPSSGLGSGDVELVDLTGNGLPDILEMNQVVRWWRNLGNGIFDTAKFMNEAPGGLVLSDPDVQMLDANGDGRADLLVNRPGMAGYFSTRFGGTWDKRSFQKYEYAPSFSFEDPEVKMMDLDGDGVTDVLRNGSRFECFYNDPLKGFYKTSVTEKRSLEAFPDISFADARVKTAEMSGDGMQDLVYIHGNNVSYWPNMGYGRFGRRITMRNSPRFPFNFDPKRLLLGDVDGDGLADMIYVENNRIILWINQGGNSWSEPYVINGTPAVSDMDSVRIADVLGSGVSGVLWSTVNNATGFPGLYFLDFTGGNKPYLLQEMNNNMGSITRVQYTSSINYYLEDEKDPVTRWKSELPFPVLVVSRVEVIDEISNGKLATEYSYHHGYWDGIEREFRGFGRVDQRDTETFTIYNTSSLVPLVTPGQGQPFDRVDYTSYSPPTETRSWFHQGALGDELSGWYENDYTHEYWQGDKTILTRNALLIPYELEAFQQLPGRAKRDALRTMRGTVLRTELYALDNSPLQNRPYTVTESVSFVRKDYQPPVPVTDTFRYASGYIFFPYSLGQRTTQWERGNDPMSSFSFNWEYDHYGQAGKQLSVALSRGIDPLTGAQFAPGSGKYLPPVMAAEKYLATYGSTTFIYKGDMLDDEADDGIYMMNRAEQSKGYDCTYSGAALAVIPFYKSIVAGSNIGAVIAHSLSYYDGTAFTGLSLGMLGDYGALVRSETLVSTDAIYAAAYGSLPETLQASPSWSSEYPLAFIDKYPERGGYLYYTSGDYTPGYYVRSAASRYDFQTGDGRGLIMASRDPFDAETEITYDDYRLLPVSVTDAEGNITTADYDYRVLQPYKVTDINENSSVFDFSPLGLLRATALIGKGTEGDYKASSGNFYARYEPSTRLEYDFFSFLNGRIPVWVKTIKREYHYQQEINDDTITSVEYSDGFGRLVQTRTQAEDVIFGNTPAERVTGDSGLPVSQGSNADTTGLERDPGFPLNVVVSGWQIYNNKGKVVEKYEPFFHYGFDYVPYLLEIFGPEVLCLDHIAVFSTVNTAGSSYVWETDGADVIGGQHTPQITLKWGTPGAKTIRVTETNAAGKSYTTAFIASVYDLPDPDLTASAWVTCTNLPVTLSVNSYAPVYTYEWNLGPGAVILEENKDYVIVQWTSPGTRAVSVTVGTTACSFGPVTLGSDIGVLAPPAPGLSTGTPVVCTGMSVLISANNFDPSYVYTWETDGGDILSQTNDTVTVSWVTPGPKTVNVHVDNGGCVVQPPAPLGIMVYKTPVPDLSTNPAAICENMAVILSANDYDPAFTYSWNLDAGAVVLSQWDDKVQVYWTVSGTKVVTVLVSNPACSTPSASHDIDVLVPPSPSLSASAPVVCTNAPVIISANDDPAYTYHWETDGASVISQSGDSITLSWASPGIRQVNVSVDNGGCIIQPASPVNIQVERTPAPWLSASSMVVCDNVPVTISANDFDPSFIYSWNLDGGTPISQTDDTVEVAWSTAGIKNVMVQVSNGGCSVNSAPFPVEVRMTPAPVITGSPVPPVNTPILYTVVAPVPGNSYNWTISPGGNLLSGQGTDTILVEWLVPFASETVEVFEDNGACGTGSAPYPVNPV